jgi:uncharacterized protein YjbJ (UPF0337 family)
MAYEVNLTRATLDKHLRPSRNTDMNKDRVVGSLKQVKGTVEETAGKLLGDAKLQIAGKADKAEGKTQNIIGTITETLKS